MSRTTGYALYIAHLGEASVRAKPLHGLGTGVMEIAVHEVKRELPCGLYGLHRGFDLCDTCLSEEIQIGDRHAEIRDRPDPAASQAVAQL